MNSPTATTPNPDEPDADPLDQGDDDAAADVPDTSTVDFLDLLDGSLDADGGTEADVPEVEVDDGYVLLDGRSGVCLDDLVADDSGASP